MTRSHEALLEEETAPLVLDDGDGDLFVCPLEVVTRSLSVATVLQA